MMRIDIYGLFNSLLFFSIYLNFIFYYFMFYYFVNIKTKYQKFNKPFYNILDPGSISIHSDLIVHGSDANLSNKRRCGLALRYTIPEVNPLAKEYLKLSYYLRGEFLECNWRNNTIPKTNDLIYKKINDDQTIIK